MVCIFVGIASKCRPVFGKFRDETSRVAALHCPFAGRPEFDGTETLATTIDLQNTVQRSIRFENRISREIILPENADQTTDILTNIFFKTLLALTDTP